VVNRLREALGDSAEKPRYIETLPRRGYRFIGAIEPVSANGGFAAKGSESSSALESLPRPHSTPKVQSDATSLALPTSDRRPVPADRHRTSWKKRGIVAVVTLIVLLLASVFVSCPRSQ